MPGMLSLAGGLPAPDLFPAEELAAVVDEVMRDSARAALQYGPVAGVPAMRECIADRAGETGAPTEPGQVLITSGSQQGLDLLARALLAAGDRVVLDDPSYLGAVQTFRAAHAELVPIPGDEDGMDTEVLAARLRRGTRCRLVYVVPHFHNPTGGVLGPERRRHLAQLAEHYGFLIVEDDPYADLAFDGARLPSVDRHTDRVVRLLSLSKTLCPGFRVAGLRGSPELIGTLAAVKQNADLQTNTFGQHVLSRLLLRPRFLPRHLSRLRRHYHARARRLAGLLTDRLPWLAFQMPRGGLFFWCTITSGVDATELWRACVASGVAVVPGPPFCVERDGTANLRLSYATLTEEEATEAVDRLAVTHAGLTGSRGAAG
jgi:2-aminoadipate transaminase